ncbi:thioredoxin family protein [Ramlibacter sp. AN1133]|uniref:thioredoxin family protein n=1 Tax=Ramlibacter sp. AN1133 TaxID=3133429 RepID=UPI0030BCA846
MDSTYSPTEPPRAQVDAYPGATVLDFGTNWCGWCRNAQPLIAQALDAQPQVRHLKVEDGPGRPLGRSYRVKLWPTLIFLKDGQEVARVVRPSKADELRDALAKITDDVKA